MTMRSETHVIAAKILTDRFQFKVRMVFQKPRDLVFVFFAEQGTGRIDQLAAGLYGMDDLLENIGLNGRQLV